MTFPRRISPLTRIRTVKNWPIFINRFLIFRLLASTFPPEKIECEKGKKKHAFDGAYGTAMAIIGRKTLIHHNIMARSGHMQALEDFAHTHRTKASILSVQLIPICGIYRGWSARPFSRDSTS